MRSRRTYRRGRRGAPREEVLRCTLADEPGRNSGPTPDVPLLTNVTVIVPLSYQPPSPDQHHQRTLRRRARHQYTSRHKGLTEESCVEKNQDFSRVAERKTSVPSKTENCRKQATTSPTTCHNSYRKTTCEPLQVHQLDIRTRHE